jgi:hypothetical protein
VREVKTMIKVTHDFKSPASAIITPHRRVAPAGLPGLSGCLSKAASGRGNPAFPLAVAKPRENAVAASWRASVPPSLHSPHPQYSIQNGISVSAWALLRVPEPLLSASVLLLLVPLPDLPMRSASDLARVPSPTSSAVPNKLAR